MKNRLLACCILCIGIFGLKAQETFPFNGVLPKDVTSVALIHANIFIDYQTYVEDATLIIEKGKVVGAGRGLTIPKNAVVMDVEGLYIYPSFIDLDSDYGMPKVVQPEWRRGGQSESNRKGAFGWNQAIRSDMKAKLMFTRDEEMAKELRGLGFGTVLTHQHDGIVRGTSALVCLGNLDHINLIDTDAAAHYSLSKGSSSQTYPSSLMGSIALLRQTYLDASWYKNGGDKSERNISLEAFNEIQSFPQFIDAGDKWNVFRTDIIGDEFGVQYIIRGGGNEYQRLEDIKKTGASFILPLSFPDAYDVSDPFLTRMVSTEEMMHWEQAPFNPYALKSADLKYAFTLSGLSDKSVFFKSLQKISSSGLTHEDVLKALTYTPASLIGKDNEVGALKTGMWANFILSSDWVTKDGAKIYENWVQGERFVIENYSKPDLSGTYVLNVGGILYPFEVTGSAGKNSAEILIIAPAVKDSVDVMDTTHVAVNMNVTERFVTMNFNPKDKNYSGLLRLTGTIASGESNWQGTGQKPGGDWINWTISRTKEKEKAETAKMDSVAKSVVLPEVIYPFVVYGRKEYPKQETLFIKNATVWTCGPQGKIENGQVLMSGGKLVAVGKDLNLKGYDGATVIDAQGKHITPGVIDEHSHIALLSVNEGAQSSSAEVEEASVVWPEDINIYRQLSGGVTTAQLLHGSANAIGGQSAIIKLRWGANAEEMLVEDAVPFIKFALGENVTHANYSTSGDDRFPLSRMGVEQLYYDHFIRAREYGEAWKSYNAGSKKKGNKLVMPRKDLEMEALWQILQKERFITCHSYIQSEINMLMHVADSMGFTINTFTHILEGYKVADKMKTHGSGASSFSDWWAYKYEVKDAIPHNGALLWEQGVTVAFNSDDAEMARRLNQEAAKAVKYGGVPEVEALKFVTLNPAKLLHLDHRIGSLEIGKDADLVIWSAHPLSIYAKAERTFVDGRRMYDVEEDAQLRKDIQVERDRIIQKMMGAKKEGEKTQTPMHKHPKHFHCDTLDNTGTYLFGQ
ncbi:MAG: amidohydrolase family protein [Flavobacteriales bacterium]|nr:amidohydrolase family protein [Flavobacteriales bacterium]